MFGNPFDHYNDMNYLISGTTSACSNIIAKCSHSSLGQENDHLTNLDWTETKWHTVEPNGQNIIDFTRDVIHSKLTKVSLVYGI